MAEMARDSINNIKFGINLITTATIDDIVNAVRKLEISDDAKDAVIDVINEQRTANALEVKNKKSPRKSVEPGHIKRVVPEANRCQRNKLDGSRCVGPKSNEVSCWSHMTASEKASHVKKGKPAAKAVSKPTQGKKYMLDIEALNARRRENLANE